MSEVLGVADLGMAFGGTPVLRGVGFTLDQGDRLAVMGRSGSGKTTLLRLIAGLEAPTEGHITIASSPASHAGRVWIAPERRGVALVFQGLALFPNLRTLDQIAFAARGRGGAERARDLLDRVGLRHRARARLDELSGGERQRIALARALAQEPRLLLMDEPFANLDDAKRAEMRDLLRALLDRSETTLILVTHARGDAFDLARRVVVLDGGHQVADDRLEAVLTRPGHAAVVRALGLGELIRGEVVDGNRAETPFGNVPTARGTKPGPVLLLVRPDQPRLVADGVAAEVVSVGWQHLDGSEVRRSVRVRVADTTIQLVMAERSIAVGDWVRVRIEGECHPVQG